MEVLIDPGLVLPDEDLTELEGAVFWLRLATWTADQRIVLGPTSFDHVQAEFARWLWPTFDEVVPRSIRKDARRVAGTLLSRAGSTLIRSMVEGDLDPDYLDSPNKPAWRRDVIDAIVDAPVRALASASEHWQDANVTDVALIGRAEPPIQVVVDPVQTLDEDNKAELRLALAGRRIAVVGAQVDQSMMSRMTTRYALASGQLTWTPCERNKPPRNLAKELPQSSNAIVICIAGRVGHSTSQAAARHASSVGADYVIAWTAQTVMDALEEFLAR